MIFGYVQRQEDRPVTETIPIVYSQASAIGAVLEAVYEIPATDELVTTNKVELKIKVEPRSNCLIVTSSPERMVEIRELIQALDQAATATVQPVGSPSVVVRPNRVQQSLDEIFDLPTTRQRAVTPSTDGK